ncbi:hypothetical protein [Bacillus sp. OV322]|uniref:hypothetical protein n=1 Tax=Bacillus sp. OV322 TaxID=1882764 RepID=UPI0015A6A055|nr:hypothetical protein [Bacillus sp. OV322]
MNLQRFYSFIFVEFINFYAIIAYKLAMPYQRADTKFKDLLIAAEPFLLNKKPKAGTPD